MSLCIYVLRQSTASEIISTQLVDIEGCLRDTSVDLDDDENVELSINLRMVSLILLVLLQFSYNYV